MRWAPAAISTTKAFIDPGASLGEALRTPGTLIWPTLAPHAAAARLGCNLTLFGVRARSGLDRHA